MHKSHCMVLVALLSSAPLGARQCRTVVLANPQSEFSLTQGQDNWFYGYYAGTLAPSDFLPMTVTLNDAWFVDPDPPAPSYWTNLTARGGHPNGPLAGCCVSHVEHWAVRRYVSEAQGAVTIAGKLADLDGGNGDGVIGKILVDNAEIFSAAIPDGDLVGMIYSLNADVTVGSVIDFAIVPRANDFEDSTLFTAVIVLIPEPSAHLLTLTCGLGVVAVCRGRLRRRL